MNSRIIALLNTLLDHTLVAGLLLLLALTGCNDGPSKKDAQQGPHDGFSRQAPASREDVNGNSFISMSTIETPKGSVTFPENPIILTDAANPETLVSTFSVDVDTSSYSLMRSLLKQGSLPDPEHVRIEEYLNYFDYGYPGHVFKEASTSENEPNTAPVSIVMDSMKTPWNPESQLVRIGIRAADASPDSFKQELGRNFVFLIDTSGSMGANGGLSLVKESMKILLEQIKPQDRVSIVTYAGSAEVKLAGAEGSQIQRIAASIDSLQSGGSTNGGAGIQTAYDLAAKAFIKGGINRVFLATDGDFNVGLTGQEPLVELIKAKADLGIFLTVLGVGSGNFNDALLEQISNRANGYATYIDSIEEARRVLIDKLASGVVTVAKDVKLQVEFQSEKVSSWRLIGYENRVMDNKDFKDDSKDAGDMGSGHETTALYEITLKPGAADVGTTTDTLDNNILGLRVRYKGAFDNSSQEISVSSSETKRHPESLAFSAGVTCFGLSLKRSQFKGSCTLGMARELAAGHINSSSVSAAAQRLREQLLTLIDSAQAVMTRTQP
jgi:Ca-activated chloride channel family protein